MGKEQFIDFCLAWIKGNYHKYADQIFRLEERVGNKENKNYPHILISAPKSKYHGLYIECQTLYEKELTFANLVEEKLTDAGYKYIVVREKENGAIDDLIIQVCNYMRN